MPPLIGIVFHKMIILVLVTICFQIYRGSEDSGELLAAFELFELGDSGR